MGKTNENSIPQPPLAVVLTIDWENRHVGRTWMGGTNALESAHKLAGVYEKSFPHPRFTTLVLGNHPAYQADLDRMEEEQGHTQDQTIGGMGEPGESHFPSCLDSGDFSLPPSYSPPPHHLP